MGEIRTTSDVLTFFGIYFGLMGGLTALILGLGWIFSRLFDKVE